MKDKEQIKNMSSVVYRLKCITCGSTYVGNTMQRLDKRIYQHRYMLQRGHSEKSVVAKHIMENNDHVNDWKNVEVLGKEEDTRKRFC